MKWKRDRAENKFNWKIPMEIQLNFLNLLNRPSPKRNCCMRVLPMETNATSIEADPMHAALAATGRSHEIPEEMNLYGWLIGSWELDVVGYDDGGSVIHSTGEAHFAWVLEGRA